MPTLTDQTQLQIGEVARLSGLPVKTVRYYEELGLLTSTVSRSPAGYRLFSAQVINRLSFIRRAQALGLSLHEIGELLSVHDRGELPCGQVKQRLQARLGAIAEQIRALETLSTELKGILCAWQDQPPIHLQGKTICPNLQSDQMGGRLSES
ncbi:MAG: heavy metal-responsive transcriptional regulator [Aphanocapsa sp. GSE-SYN-MK-11-07L]|nr:heavy metal-responsive transcriptional regulator [Aphanocapsa sp. GSE-SYN-MK-11-07L]